MKLTPTKQQTSIIKAARVDAKLKIVAGAGAAKSSTLSMIASDLKVPCLYLAYNKAMAVEAHAKFPSNVECRSTHSLAYKYEGVAIAHKLSRPYGAYVNVAGSPTEIAKYYKIKPILVEEDTFISSVFIAAIVKDTVAKFEHSDHRSISKLCIPFHINGDIEKRYGKKFVKLVSNTVLIVAKKLWDDRIDVKSKVLATHDTYLKMFELSGTTLSQYDMVFLDESQDANDCTISILATKFSPDTRIVAVGDPFQQIYQFRGSVNALNKIDGNKYTLSKSFRFGQELADLASTILGGKFQLGGNDKVTTKIGNNVITNDEVHTEIFRTNSCLINRGISLLSENIPVFIDFDTRDFVNKIRSVQELQAGNVKGVKHIDIIPFNTFAEFLSECEDNFELNRYAKIILNGDADYYIDTLTSYKKPDRFDVHLITAHRSKGIEWDNVLLADDFPSIYDKDGRHVGLNELEENLLYVACTRAKLKLHYNNTVQEILALGNKQNLTVGNITVTKFENYMSIADTVVARVFKDAEEDEMYGDCTHMKTKDDIDKDLSFYSSII